MQAEEYPKDEIEKLFYANYNSLSEAALLDINERIPNGDINNVVVGLEKHCFGLWVNDDSDNVVYQLVYVNGQKRLEGDTLLLSLDLKYREYVLLFFSYFLAHNYHGLDVIDTFNIFQKHTQSMLEKVGYITIEGSFYKSLKNPTFFAPNKRGVIVVNFIDKLSFYRDLLGSREFSSSGNCKSTYIYLMLNKRNGLIKIGKSNNPRFREKTLQSDEPEIEIIIAWEAPAVVEKELHILFADKRKRGEWFELSTANINKIKTTMSNYT